MAITNAIMKPVITTLRISVSVILLYLILSKIDWQVFSANFLLLDRVIIASAALTFAVIMMLEMTQLWLVFRRAGMRFFQIVSLHFAGVAFNYVLPGQIGSDLYKSAMASKRFGGFLQPALFVFWLRFCGVAVMLIAIILGFILEPAFITRVFKQLSLEVGFAYYVMGAVLLPFLGWFFLSGKLARSASAWNATSLTTLFSELWLVFISIPGIALLILIARLGLFYFLIMAVGLSIEFVPLLFVVTLSALATSMPISIAGLGVRESAIIFMLMSAGSSLEQATIVALTSRVFMLVTAMVGAILIMHQHVFSDR